MGLGPKKTLSRLSVQLDVPGLEAHPQQVVLGVAEVDCQSLIIDYMITVKR